MTMTEFIQKYWPFMAMALWFYYRHWKSRRVLAMLPALQLQGALFVDVRSAAEFAAASAAGTVNIPLNELGHRLGEIPRTAPVVVCCASGTRSGMARMLLKKNGYDKVYNIGSWRKFPQ